MNDLTKPVIRPPVKYLVFQPGSTFALTCETTILRGNVSWESPKTEFPPVYKTSTTISTWKREENNITVAILTVSNATYADTGYYACKRENDQTFSKQYVFIPGLYYI